MSNNVVKAHSCVCVREITVYLYCALLPIGMYQYMYWFCYCNNNIIKSRTINSDNELTKKQHIYHNISF